MSVIFSGVTTCYLFATAIARCFLFFFFLFFFHEHKCSAVDSRANPLSPYFVSAVLSGATTTRIVIFSLFCSLFWPVYKRAAHCSAIFFKNAIFLIENHWAQCQPKSKFYFHTIEYCTVFLSHYSRMQYFNRITRPNFLFCTVGRVCKCTDR